MPISRSNTEKQVVIHRLLIEARRRNFSSVELTEAMRNTLLIWINQNREKIRHQEHPLSISMFDDKQLMKHAYSLMVYLSIKQDIDNQPLYLDNYAHFYTHNRKILQAIQENNPFFLKFHLETLYDCIQNDLLNNQLSQSERIQIHYNELIRLVDAVNLLGDQHYGEFKQFLCSMLYFTLATVHSATMIDAYLDLNKAKGYFHKAYLAACIGKNKSVLSSMTMNFLMCETPLFKSFPFHSLNELKSHIVNLPCWYSEEIEEFLLITRATQIHSSSSTTLEH